MQEQIIDGRYRICGRIGQGGMSTVYLAEELQTKEQVALKWVRRAQMRRFGISEQDVQREAELMRGIDHPALPPDHPLHRHVLYRMLKDFWE